MNYGDFAAGWQPPPAYAHLCGLRSGRMYLLDELDNLSKRQELVKAELARVDGEIAKATDSLSKQQ